MAQIRILKDNDKNTIYPQSVTQAIVDANGVNLDTILHNTVMTNTEEDVADVIVGYEDINNKVTEITEDSTDVQYPSAKAVHDFVANDLSNYYDKTTVDGKFAAKDKYGDTAISLGRRTDTGSVGSNSVATGDRTQANGNYSVAIGSLAQANAMATVALGREVRANGAYSVALGEGAIAKNQGEVAAGKWNIEDTTGKILHSVGNGTSSSARSNAYTIDNEGDAWFSGDVYVGSNSGTNKDEGSKRLARIDEVPTIETGTFTPYLHSTNAYIDYVNFAIQEGSYTKMGKLVFYNLTVQLTGELPNKVAKTSPTIRGLPFNTVAGKGYGVNIVATDNWASGHSQSDISHPYLEGGENIIRLPGLSHDEMTGSFLISVEGYCWEV